jgi:RNA polymerase sigma-70 factor (ECF subfamily)
MTDEQLVQGCDRNDPNAQRQLYEKFSRKMFGVCLRYANNKEEAEDLLQDGFVKVYSKLSSYKGEGSLEGWIRKVMVNTALDNLRKQKIEWSSEELIDQFQVEPASIAKIGANELLNLVAKLPNGFRTVFNLYAIEGYTHQEIGELLGISENTSKSQYARARVQLMNSVNNLYSEKQADSLK